MTTKDLPALLERATSGNWFVTGDDDHCIGDDTEGLSANLVCVAPDRLLDSRRLWDDRAELIALAPALARRVIELEAVIGLLGLGTLRDCTTHDACKEDWQSILNKARALLDKPL